MKLKHLIALLLAAALLLGVGAPAFAADTLRLIVPADWELEVGDSRTVDYVFSSGVTDRMLTWTAQSQGGAATVDKWGRVTAVSPGEVAITASQTGGAGLTDTVTLKVTASSAKGAAHAAAVNYQGTAVAELENLQKLVTRWTTLEAQAAAEVPDEIKAILGGTDTDPHIAAETADGAEWTIEAYGVLRTGGIAATARDEEMRFMGDRYFHYPAGATGTSYPVVSAILPDGGYGIWTITASGVTHIAMVEMTATEKAIKMSDTSQALVARRGMVSDAGWNGTAWVPRETDNDGLWTAMYGAGELFRYAALKRELAGNPFSAELRQAAAEAKAVATQSVEAVLLLSNISMREGTAEAYIRYNQEGYVDSRSYTGAGGTSQNDNGQGLSYSALELNGDYSRKVPDFSPWNNSAIVNMGNIVASGNISSGFTGNPLWLGPFASSAWSNPQDPGNTAVEYEKQTRLLEGFWARTYSLKNEPGDATNSALNASGRIYYEMNGDGTATGKSLSAGVVNGERLYGVTVDASGGIPGRLLALIGDHPVSDIIYKGDTSMDEVIGHLFIYKIAYDILGPEDPELAGIIADTMEKFAQHLSDNSYMLVDATGQPTTWGKINREYFYSYRWGSPAGPMNCSVLLCAFKLAAYVTGNRKWEDEYRLAAKLPPYEYSTLMQQYEARGYEFLNMFAASMLRPVTGMLAGDKTLFGHLTASGLSKEIDFLIRSFAQYSDEEMAMLAFYLLFQLETDEDLLVDYRAALDYWWDSSFQYSENPLWYYIYQLAYPDETIADYYGNNVLDTAAWSLSRHPVDTRKWNASNTARDDLMIFDAKQYDSSLDTRGGLSVVKTELPPTAIGGTGLVGILLFGGLTTGGYNLAALGIPAAGTLDIEYAVAAPDERAMHKYNNSSYRLDDDNSPNQMEGSTTYTLPYWLGVYHGMLDPLPTADYAAPPAGPGADPDPGTGDPIPASELFDDVRRTDWFHDAVTFVANEGLFQGVGNKLFAPDETMNRAMMATVLYRLAGEPAAGGAVSFTDAVPGAWYYKALAWASAGGVVTGYDAETFGPLDTVTREQIAAMLYRYAQLAQLDTSGTTTLAGFTDADAVSAYALAAVSWAVASGIIEGRGNNTLAPQAKASRAEVAAMSARFCEKIK